jgi:hypothetical protein
MSKDEIAFVERTLGNSVICHRCDATLGSYSEDCTADLQDPCPGFLAIEQARADFGEKQAC